MIQVNIKAMSVNKAWMGRRIKTKDYEEYTGKVLALLPDNVYIPEGPLFIHIVFGHSNATMYDWDNGVKPFQDILQQKYNFNDSSIYLAFVEKKPTNKGEEYISFLILPYFKARDYFKELLQLEEKKAG